MLTVRVQTRPAPLKEACRGQRSTQSNRCALRRGGRGGNGSSTKGVLFSSGRPKRKFMCRAAGDDSEASNGTAQAEDAEQRKYWGPPPEERDEVCTCHNCMYRCIWVVACWARLSLRLSRTSSSCSTSLLCPRWMAEEGICCCTGWLVHRGVQ